MVAVLHGIQLRILESSAGLSPHSGLDMDSQDMLSQSSKGRRQLVTFCHMLAEEMPSQFGDGLDVDAFGGIGCTDEASQSGNIVSDTCASVESICRELITSLSAFM